MSNTALPADSRPARKQFFSAPLSRTGGTDLLFSLSYPLSFSDFAHSHFDSIFVSQISVRTCSTAVSSVPVSARRRNPQRGRKNLHVVGLIPEGGGGSYCSTRCPSLRPERICASCSPEEPASPRGGDHRAAARRNHSRRAPETLRPLRCSNVLH